MHHAQVLLSISTLHSSSAKPLLTLFVPGVWLQLFAVSTPGCVDLQQDIPVWRENLLATGWKSRLTTRPSSARSGWPMDVPWMAQRRQQHKTQNRFAYNPANPQKFGCLQAICESTSPSTRTKRSNNWLTLSQALPGHLPSQVRCSPITRGKPPRLCTHLLLQCGGHHDLHVLGA